MFKGFGTTAVTDQERLGKNLIVSPSIQEITDQFFRHFRDLEDPRVERTRDHKLIDIIAIAILAVMSGASLLARYGRLWQE